MKRVLWFFLTVSILLIMLLYAKHGHQGVSAYGFLSYAFLYDVRTGVRIQMTEDPVAYMGLITLYSIGILYMTSTASALQRSFVPFVMGRLRGRGGLVTWSMRSVLGSGARFTSAFVLAVLLCSVVLFHTVSTIDSRQLWMLAVQLFLTLSWLGHAAFYANMKYGRFTAVVSGIVIIAAFFPLATAFGGVSVLIFSGHRAMQWGVLVSIVLYMATALSLRLGLANIDI